MRPGQKAPDNSDSKSLANRETMASMRPGQKAPDNRDQPVRLQRRDSASMRPGQKAPDNRGIEDEDYRALLKLQ